jgi:trigger factor
MQSQIDQISPVVVQVKIEVPWSKVNENLEGAYRNLQRTARVRGFRPGKVPRHVVKSLLGKSVEREVTNRLLEEGLAEAVREHSLEPVAMADVQTPPIAEGQPLNFTAQLEVKPKIEAVDTGSLTLERKDEPVTDAEVEAEIERLREQNSELVAVNPARPGREGDVLTLKIDVSVDGQPRPEMSSEDTRAALGAERLLPEIEAGLLGMQVGETKDIELTLPDSYGRDELRNKPAVFQVHVKEMQQKLLPDLDDEFARDLEHESLEALRADVMQRLREAARQRAESLLREQVIDRLIDMNPVPVPPSLIERQHQQMLEELFQFQQMLGRALPFDEAMHAEMQQRAERKIRAGLLLGAIADQQKIDVSEADLDAKLRELAEASGKHIAKVKAEYQGERREGLRSQILQNKLLEYLLSQATITEAGAGPAALETPAAEPAADAGGQPADTEGASEVEDEKPESKRKSLKKTESKGEGEQG